MYLNSIDMVWLLIVKLGAVLSTYMAKLAVTSLKLKTGPQHMTESTLNYFGGFFKIVPKISDRPDGNIYVLPNYRTFIINVLAYRTGYWQNMFLH